MSKHTPGPWKIEWPDWDVEWECYHDPDAGHFDGLAKISGEGWSDFSSVSVMVDGEEDDAGIANAHLIAAAPELLDQCILAQKCYRQILATAEKAGLIPQVEACRQLLNGLDKAIAKAQGGESC